MSNIARRFRVSTWTHTYTDEIDSQGIRQPVAPTFFSVQLLNLTMDAVEESKGIVVLEIDTAEALTSESYRAIRQQLIERKLLSDGGTLDISGDADALETMKAERWNTIASIRDGLETKGFPYLGHWLDSDERSVARINTTAQAAMAASMLGSDFTADWTTADNSVLSMTREQVIGMPVAFAMYADALHKKARELRQRIEAAEGASAVRQCYWEDVEEAPAAESNPEPAEATPMPEPEVEPEVEPAE